jgi:NAD(P)-dependent dehydrogenase (short-subunit alcohol dehydrogenase family)
VHVNVTREIAWQEATAMHTYGKLESSSATPASWSRANIKQTSGNHWDRIIALKVTAVFLGTKHAIPAMRRAGGSSIINISSTARLVGSPSEHAGYTAAPIASPARSRPT